MTGSKICAVAKELRRRIAAIPGIVDAHLQQEVYAPDFYVQIDRARALQLGLTASDIGNNIGTSLSSSEQVSPNFWTDPTNGIPYYIAVQTPEYQVSSLDDLGNTPVSTGTAPPTTQPVPGELQNVATFTRDSVPGSANQANIQPVYEVYASTQGRDLGSVATDIDKITTELKKQLKPGNTIQVTGQIDSMNQAFRDMGDRAAVRRRVRLPADGRELSEFRRSVRRDPGVAGDVLRHRHDALHHRHDAERALADGRDHGGRRRLGELDPARHLRARAAARRA